MRKGAKVIILLGVTTVLVLSVFFLSGVVFLSKNDLSHIFHLMCPPEDLYAPIVLEEFQLYHEGYTHTFSLSPKYYDSYVIGFTSTKQNISVEDIYDGALRAEFYWKNELLFEKTSTSQLAAIYADSEMKFYKKVVLIDFEIPLLGKYKDEISVKLTVLKADEKLKKYADSTKLFIGVSPLP